MSRKVRKTRAHGGQASKMRGYLNARRKITLPIMGRKKEALTGPGGCHHALAMHEEVTDKHGRKRTISFARACVVRHETEVKVIRDTPGWAQLKVRVPVGIHKDQTGREWE